MPDTMCRRIYLDGAFDETLEAFGASARAFLAGRPRRRWHQEQVSASDRRLVLIGQAGGIALTKNRTFITTSRCNWLSQSFEYIFGLYVIPPLLDGELETSEST